MDQYQQYYPMIMATENLNLLKSLAVKYVLSVIINGITDKIKIIKK
jgi:hypothetical protein